MHPKDFLFTTKKVKEEVPDLQVSDAFLEALNAKFRVELMRAAERCRGRGGKRLSKLDV